MENQTQTLNVVAPVPEAPKPKSKSWRIVLPLLVVMIMGGLGYAAYTNPQLFRAALTETTVPQGVASLTIPNYDTGPQDSGLISVTVRPQTPATVTETLVGVQFKLNWTPATALSLAQALVFDGDTVFKSADLSGVNTTAPGEATVSLFNGTGVSVSNAADGDGKGQKLFKLNAKINAPANSTIRLTASEVQVIKLGTAGDYVDSTAFTSVDAGTISVKSQSDLRVLRAEALDKNTVLVTFSDLLGDFGQSTDYTFVDNLLSDSAVATGYASGLGQDTVKLTTGDQVPGTVYALSVSGTAIKGNVQGGLDTVYSKAIVVGFQDPAAVPAVVSQVKLASVEGVSATSLRLRFSDAVKNETVTPLNIKIERFNGAVVEPLTIRSIAADSVAQNTYDVVTDQQVADANYFVRMNGVKDSSDLLLGNNQVLNFLGYSAPVVVITRIQPEAVVNDLARDIVVIGRNLGEVDSARINTTALEIQAATRTDTQITLTVPQATAEGVYDLNLVDRAGRTVSLPEALVVQVSTTGMQVVSERSSSVPARVAPDGTTPVSFYVLVEDPVALNQVSGVSINLQPIGGSPAQAMTKKTGPQPKNGQFWTTTATVSATTPTKDTPYELAVEAKKGAEVATGTVSLMVTRATLGSVAPTIDQAYISPMIMPPDGETKAKVTAVVTDTDGASTIKSVIADLGAAGVGFVALKPIGEAADAAQTITGYYSSEEFTVPKTTAEKDYPVKVTVIDETGNTVTKDLTLTVSASATAPKFDKSKSYITPRSSIPKDGKTKFSISVMLTDLNGISDIDSVTAYFNTLKMPPEKFVREPEPSETAKSAFYSTAELAIPTTAPIGSHDIEIVATSKAGGQSNLILQLEVTTKDMLGDPPYLNGKMAKTNPKVAVNDGATSVTLYAFVRDDDSDLESVVVDLAGIGQVGPELPPDFGETGFPPAAVVSSGDVCAGGDTGLYCMTPSFVQGNEGQWYVLSGVTVSTSVQPSSQPYQIPVMATDNAGHVTRGTIPLYVSSAEAAVRNLAPAVVAGAVATDANTVEVVFSKSMAKGLSIKDFSISARGDASQTLNVVGVTLDAVGRVAKVATESQVGGSAYVLTVSSKVLDTAGIALSSGAKAQASFNGFAASDKAPVIDFIGATDGETVEIDFQEPIRPSSLRLGEGAPANIKIFEAGGTGAALAVKSVGMLDDKSIEVKTETQKSGVRYRVEISDLQSASGVKSKAKLLKFFKSVNLKAIQQVAVAMGADLNGDGRVDFIDFTMFSAVYGQSLATQSAAVEEVGQGLQPIEPTPDSTVPHTTPVGY